MSKFLNEIHGSGVVDRNIPIFDSKYCKNLVIGVSSLCVSLSPKTGVTTIIYMQTGGKKILTFHFFFTLSERTEIAAKKNNVNTPLYIVPLPLVSSRLQT